MTVIDGSVQPWAVIWDLDGTLVDTEQQHFEAWVDLCANLGKPLTFDEFKPTFGRRNSDILLQWFGPQSAEWLQAKSDWKEELFRARLARAAASGAPIVLPGARDLLDRLATQGALQAVASSAPPENIPFITDLVGITPMFDALISGANVARGKPAPDIFLAAATALGVGPARCLVVEDAVPGVQAACAAGMLCLAVTNTVSAAQLLTAGATVVVDRLDDPQLDQFPWPFLAFLHPVASVVSAE